jgi:hypothetical protein
LIQAIWWFFGPKTRLGKHFEVSENKI